MSRYDMVAFIVLVVMMASVLRAWITHGGRRGRRGKADEAEALELRHEVRRLSDDVTVLKERLGVIERITVEKENSLAREIESLRDRPELGAR